MREISKDAASVNGAPGGHGRFVDRSASGARCQGLRRSRSHGGSAGGCGWRGACHCAVCDIQRLCNVGNGILDVLRKSGLQDRCRDG